jgi:glycosyltransferase involved in cell wall biosynthesis
VILPVYNGERYLLRSAGSVLVQTYRDLEFIIINDGSTDTTPTLCQGLAGRDPRVRVLHQSNAGVSSARNTGLDHARGRMIAFIDCDDMYRPDYLRVMCDELAGDASAGAVMCNYSTTSGEAPPKVMKNLLSAGSHDPGVVIDAMVGGA